MAASYAKPTYIEIGVYKGDCLAEVAPVCGEAHGVDVSFERLEFDVAGARLWEMTSDAFFESYDGPRPDIVFVDGDHAYEQARRDTHNALEILTAEGVLFMHDTWPVFRAATERMVCGGVHRVVEELQADERWEVATIRRWPGLSVVTRRGPALMGG
ncbi:MAG: class I SAM-dependent methyltransferase [Actinomycetota bacterium]|nr:class I SAM-dependent methyltransferase [Actinomycetota bacterium]